MPGESLNILMYDIATYTRANIEKMANSLVRLDARSDYKEQLGVLTTTYGSVFKFHVRGGIKTRSVMH